MGYFNYFIKCIIRKFVNLLFKPKVLLTFLVVISLLFVLQITSRAEWTDSDITTVLNQLTSIVNACDTQVGYLMNIGIDVDSLLTELLEIQNLVGGINSMTDNIDSKMTSLIRRIDTLNSEIKNIYNSLEENQQELLAELEADNQAVLEELNMIRESIIGTENKNISFTDLGNSDISLNGLFLPGIRKIYIPMEFGYTYNITVSYTNTFDNTMNTYYFPYHKYVSGSNEVISASRLFLGSVESQCTREFSFICTDETKPYIYFYFGNYINSISVTASIPGINGSLDTNNQLQQESNQLQQEQNNLIKDDNVNTDGLEFATDDTVNPTSDGFNTLFNTIYNAFCNTSSEPLTITLPFINKTFTIQPNIVSNGMQKAGLGVIVTLINSYYYFSVCLFIYKDIAKIVDDLKSGNITSDCGNVKTEVL